MKFYILLLSILLLAPGASALSVTLEPLATNAQPGSTVYVDAAISGSGTYNVQIDSVICKSSAGTDCAFVGNDIVSVVFNDTGTTSAEVSAPEAKKIKIILSPDAKETASYSYKVIISGNESASATGDINVLWATSSSHATNQNSNTPIEDKVESLSITSNDLAGTILVNFNAGIANPALTISKVLTVPEAAESLVYQYLLITKWNFNNSGIENATIEFRVNKSWILENNISEVYLSRYDNGWNKLRTELISSSEEYSTYLAYASGFSYFAIIGKKVEQPAISAKTETQPAGTSSPAPIATPTGLAFFGTARNAGVVVAIILILSAAYYYIVRMKKPPVQ